MKNSLASHTRPDTENWNKIRGSNLDWTFLSGLFSNCWKPSDLQIQISKKKKNKWHRLQLKRKLHQLWRIAMWLSHDCSKSNEFLTPACFSKDDAILCTGARNSSLGDKFWLTVVQAECTFSVLYLLLFSPSQFEKMFVKFKREMLYCAWW